MDFIFDIISITTELVLVVSFVFFVSEISHFLTRPLPQIFARALHPAAPRSPGYYASPRSTARRGVAPVPGLWCSVIIRISR